MNNMTAQWEDDDNNRQVEFSVNYRIDNANVEIADVTPTRISIFCPKTNECVRTIGVHTEKGRQILASQINEAGQVSQIQNAIAEEAGLLVTA